jgi:hypothetical protein
MTELRTEVTEIGMETECPLTDVVFLWDDYLVRSFRVFSPKSIVIAC